jgi:ABC-type multidrug transport system ATPase subunit
MARVDALPEDYRFVFKEIQKHMWMFAGDDAASVCGFDVVRRAEKVRENISLTGQFAAVDGILTGRENLILIANLRGVPNPAQIADKIAILHDGKIIANGTLDELKKLFPPAKTEYIEKQPALEEIFLAIIGRG